MELSAQTRQILGKGVKILRKNGLVPAELYGHNLANIHLAVPVKEFSRVLKQAGESTVIKLKTEDKEFNVLVHDVLRNHLTDEFSHIDFYAVKMDEKIKVKVAVVFIGEAPVIKEKNGVLVKAIQEIEVEALPADLPHNIEVNLGSLTDIGSTISVKDLKIGEKVKILVNPEAVIASVIEQKEEEAAPVVNIEEVKVEGEEKRKEKEKEKEEITE
ncbi:MAG: 50S ribosomal protein L25 [Patescibacteria group bacterium]